MAFLPYILFNQMVSKDSISVKSSMVLDYEGRRVWQELYWLNVGPNGLQRVLDYRYNPLIGEDLCFQFIN